MEEMAEFNLEDELVRLNDAGELPFQIDGGNGRDRNPIEMVSAEAPNTTDLVSLAYNGQNGCAELFVRLCREKFCFDHASRLWFEFGGHFWKLDTLDATVRALDAVQEEFRRAYADLESQIIVIGNRRRRLTGADDNPKIDNLNAHIKKLEKHRKAVSIVITNLNSLSYRKQVAEFSAVGINSLGVTGDDWDLDPWSLAVENGVVDLRTGELREGKPEDFIKNVVPTAFDPKAQCPNFEKFLLEILDGDEDVALFLKRLLGAALIGNATIKQYIGILSGAGRNGKDTLIGTIAHVLGLNICAPIPAELLLDSNNKRSSQGPSADLMKLRGLRLAYCNETSEGRRFNVGLVKNLSGGGHMTAREPYGRRNVDWEQSHMLLLMTNRRPHAPVDDYAFWKRIRNVHFPLSFVSEPKEPHERKVDTTIGERLKTEASGVLTWLVSGCLEYQGLGLSEPAAVRAATAEYIRDVDLLGLFLEERCITGPQYRTKSGPLFNAYKDWATENNHRPITGTAFGRDMARRFKKEGKTYVGVGLLDE